MTGRSDRTPVSTYRVQLTPESGFQCLTEAADYLSDLGVSHAYLSPILESTPGSQHGYDVVDHTRVDQELGGEEGLRVAAAALLDRHVGLVVDVVPNHMALPTPEFLNQPLWSVLRDGPESICRNWFDIDWGQQQPVLLPILGQRIDASLDAGELKIDPSGPFGEPVLRYFDHVFPLRPGTAELPLEELLAAQHYRLAYWRVAHEEVNYRRFFDVDTLVAIRVEDPRVFDESNAIPVRLVREGLVDGLRIDHPDGLADPRGYLRRLADATGDAWIVVEKILEPGEDLPEDWECAGTTGYDAMLRIGSLFVDPSGAPVMTAAFAEDTGIRAGWQEVSDAARREVLSGLLAAEVDRLAAVAHDACQVDVRLRDYSRRGMTEAVAELLACMSVYRAYVVPGEDPPVESVRLLEAAAEEARRRLPQRAPTVDLMRDLALGRLGRGVRKDEFLVRFQQTTGPAIAKGVEDTASYRWFPLSSLCEVGGEPDHWGISRAEFHAWAERRRREWPHAMTAMSTHDNKRSEDVRARLSVLSEIAGEWVTTVRAWRELVGAFVGPDDVPDPSIEWLAWQTMVGAYPIDADRLIAYLTKAAREAKLRTSWTLPEEGYEHALGVWVRRLSDDEGLQASIAQMIDRLAPGFAANVLGQRVVQVFAPGVPDIYQGCEFVSLRLVDPDNRSPVDFTALQAALQVALETEPDPNIDVSAAKARLTAVSLRLRRDRPDLVGPDVPHTGLEVTGTAAEHCVAFARGTDLIVLASRYVIRLAAAGGWGDTAVPVPAGSWRDVVTGREFVSEGSQTVAHLLDEWPVAVLVKEGG